MGEVASVPRVLHQRRLEIGRLLLPVARALLVLRDAALHFGNLPERLVETGVVSIEHCERSLGLDAPVAVLALLSVHPVPGVARDAAHREPELVVPAAHLVVDDVLERLVYRVERRERILERSRQPRVVSGGVPRLPYRLRHEELDVVLSLEPDHHASAVHRRRVFRTGVGDM